MQLRFLDGLRILTTALDSEAHLTIRGRQQTRAALAKALSTQICVHRLHKRHPEIAQTPIQPIFITGLLRTGTTFLQHLLARHPGLRSPRLWELMAPASPHDQTRLIAECESYVDEYYRAAPQFRTIHPLAADEPEECHRLTANSFRHFIYALRYHVPSYVRWLRGQDMTEAYQFHRSQLRCLLWRGPGNPVVLKCPSHLWHLDALKRVYPNAKVVRLHRHPSVSVPSAASLTAVVRKARSDRVDREKIGAYWLEEASIALNRIRNDGRHLDIRYADLVADPLRVAALVCDYAGTPMTRQAAANMADFLATQRGSKGHRYTAEEFGLSARHLDDHFAKYIAEFGLQADSARRRVSREHA
ncbi:sulfotransferase family protein [Allorhizocola rhizosphaerae]|uniref:sulfotransferase family protein n=1 Tax=Allorhizocola rhizosphaerae TaxID=1872709 RepID=UPI000E3CA7F1|nr:sulfotransferase [Allorhizocola rhizosphaerae]